MESLFSEWFKFHKCVLTGDCSILDLSDANFFIDFVIFVGGGGSCLAIRRFINCEQVFDRNWHGRFGLPTKCTDVQHPDKRCD